MALGELDGVDVEPLAPTGYVIDVCLSCGRQATWPFCEHRPTGMSGSAPWTTSLTVRPARGARARLQREMTARAR